MKRFIVAINDALKLLCRISMDKNIPGASGENVCCQRLKMADHISIPSLGIIRLNINYCFVCGRKIKR